MALEPPSPAQTPPWEPSTDPGQAQTALGHTGSRDTGTARQLLCRLLHTKPRGAVQNRPFPAPSLAGSCLHRTHGHSHAGSVPCTPPGTRVPSSCSCPRCSRGSTGAWAEPRIRAKAAGPGAPGLLWSTSSEQKPNHLNKTAQGPRAAPWDTLSWLPWLQGWPGKGLSWCSDGAQKPQKHRPGGPVTAAECWVQDGAQKSI